MVELRWGGENALERYAKVQHEKRLPVFVRLAAACVADGLRHGRQVAIAGGVKLCRSSVGEHGACRKIRVTRTVARRHGPDHVVVHRDFGDSQGMRLLAAGLSLRVASADMNRHAAAQIGQTEGGLAVAAIRSAEQGKQGLILVDG